MIYRIRSMTLKSAQAAAVRDVSKRAAAYVTKNYEGIDVEIWENVAGNQRQIHMATKCMSLRALEEYEAKRKSDPQWTALVDEVQALDGVTETVDSLYRTV